MMVQALRAAVLCVLLVQAAGAQAADPDTNEMIRALSPPRDRGMRNLLVRARAEDHAASAAAVASAADTGTTPTATAAAPPVAQPAPPPAGPVAPPTQQAEAQSAHAGPPSLQLDIHFDVNSPHVRPESGPLLGNLVAALQSPELKGSRFVIEGHTDASGSAAANQRLSQERADEVRLYLVALGVHPSRLRAVGKGSSEPVNAHDPTAAENRRVRVVTMQ